MQNLNPNTTDFVPATAGAVRVTKTGNPNLNNGLFPYYPFRLRVTMSPTAGQNYDVNFSISQRGYGSSAQVVVSYLYGAVDMNGLFVSGGDEVVILDSNTVSGSQVDIPLRVTRGRTRFTNPVSVTMPQGTVHTVEVGITTVGNLPYTQQYADGFVLSPGSTPGMSTLTLDLTGDKILAAGRYYGYLYVSAPGVPSETLQFDLTVTSNPSQLSVTPSNITFTYLKGNPEPAPVQISVFTASSVRVSTGTYDASWITMNLPVASSFLSVGGTPRTFTLTPSMSNKSAGEHTTTIQFSTADGIVRVTVHFLVADGQASLSTSVVPEGGGTVEGGGPVANGQSVTLTARAAPGFVFTRWSGSFAGVNNPTSFVVLGAMNVVAEFTPVTSGCTYTLSKSKVLIPAGGDVGRVDITTQANCTWGFSTLPSWMASIGGTTGTGSGSLKYTAVANPQSAIRQVTLLIGGMTLPVEQAGSGCTDVAPSPAPVFAAAGGNATIAIDGAANCSFTPYAADSWLTSTSPDPFQGNPSVVATAAANVATGPRGTTLYLAGVRVPVLQRGTQFTTVFGDINANSNFADYINTLERAGIADLCPTGFCPDAPTTRAQMAEFLVHSLLRVTEFSYPTTPLFSDVPATHPRFKWIQKLADMGVTTGCGNGRYCPDDSVTRGQVAVFLVRARGGINASATFPYRNAAYFSDVPVGHSFFSFVQKLRDWGITAGCSATKFCPDDVVSRGQMSVFLVRGFLTP